MKLIDTLFLWGGDDRETTCWTEATMIFQTSKQNKWRFFLALTWIPSQTWVRHPTAAQLMTRKVESRKSRDGYRKLMFDMADVLRPKDEILVSNKVSKKRNQFQRFHGVGNSSRIRQVDWLYRLICTSLLLPFFVRELWKTHRKNRTQQISSVSVGSVVNLPMCVFSVCFLRIKWKEIKGSRSRSVQKNENNR